MRPPRVASLHRFSAQADEAARRDFGQRFLDALDRIGVEPDGEFIVGHPDVMDPSVTDLGPFARRSDASRDAALQNYPQAGSQRERVLHAIAKAGVRGATRDELAQTLELGDSTVDARVWELKRGAFVRDEPERQRDTRQGGKANVLVLTDKARLVLADELSEAELALW